MNSTSTGEGARHGHQPLGRRGAQGDSFLTTFSWKNFGTLPYDQGRAMQSSSVRARVCGTAGDVVLACEHNPVITLGRRVSEAAHARVLARCQGLPAQDIEVFRSERGGEATFHGPGQLVIYPVMSLRERGLGVRAFVEMGLEAIACALQAFALDTEISLMPAGLWVNNKKLGFVGLRIVNGVTDHGFSLSVGGDLSPFSLIDPCGMAGVQITSVEQELGSRISIRAVEESIREEWGKVFG